MERSKVNISTILDHLKTYKQKTPSSFKTLKTLSLMASPLMPQATNCLAGLSKAIRAYTHCPRISNSILFHYFLILFFNCSLNYFVLISVVVSFTIKSPLGLFYIAMFNKYLLKK